MASPGSTPREAAPQSAWSIPGMIGDWIRQGAEGFIATQKILLDLAAQQNALALTIARERLGLVSPSPSKTLVDLSSKSVHNFMEAQQTVLDIVARENNIIFEGLKPAVENTAVGVLAEIVHQGLANCVSAQKHFLEIVESEAEGTVKDLADGKGLNGQRLSSVTREGVRTFVQNQKKFLDIVEKELVEKKEEPKEPVEAQAVNVFDMAKDSVDAYVDSQKRLLDIASDQIDVNVKFIREFLNIDIQKGSPTTTLPDVLKKSADSFVAAQKALVELASKPRKPTSEKSKPEPEIVVAKA